MRFAAAGLRARRRQRLESRFAFASRQGDLGNNLDVIQGAQPFGCGEPSERLRARSASMPTALSRGDVATVSDTTVTVTHGANVAADISWAQGGLAFDATPIPDVIRDLARTFNLDITLADSSLAREAITVRFGPDFSADEVLDIVTRTIGARYEKLGRRVLIRRRVGAAGRQLRPGQARRSSHPGATQWRLLRRRNSDFDSGCKQTR